MNSQRNGAAPERVDFSKIKTSIPIPNLIEVQKHSYERFLQMDLLPNEREDTGLQTVFNSVFPISDFRGVSQLDRYLAGTDELPLDREQPDADVHVARSTARPSGRSAVPAERNITRRVFYTASQIPRSTTIAVGVALCVGQLVG
jgi:DNA-directed RNA polymerase beta subunit